MLRVEAIAKSFGPVAALRSVSLRVRPGTVHGLLGENGAGKSTLMNILFGLVTPDAGRILIDDRPVQLSSPRAAQRLGIGMVHQHFKLVGTLSVLENFALAVQPGLGSIDRRHLLPRLTELAASLHWQIDPQACVGTLSVGQQQRLEIIKALASGGRFLILDEPTAVLTPQEATDLAGAVRTLAQRGTAVIFISHKLNEIASLCDEVTILRHGRVAHAGPAAAVTPTEMARYMLGVAPTPLHPTVAPGESPGPEGSNNPPHPNPRRPTSLRLIHLHAPGLKGINLDVPPGQIIGIAGVDGNGQSALVNAIVGALKPTSGLVDIADLNVTAWSIHRRRRLLGLIPEDRHLEALVLSLSVTRNLLLKDYHTAPYSRGFLPRSAATLRYQGPVAWLKLSQWRTFAQNLVTRYRIRCASIDEPVGSLSGGNQQKVVLARELGSYRPLVIAINPTRGLDVGATAFVLQQLQNARTAGGGAGVLLIHSDLDELLALADRIHVLYNGTLLPSPLAPSDPEARSIIGRMMLGLPAFPLATPGPEAKP